MMARFAWFCFFARDPNFFLVLPICSHEHSFMKRGTSAPEVRQDSTRHGKSRFDWREDLLHSRDVKARDVDAYGFALSWYEEWRVKRSLDPGRESARQWWQQAVKNKERDEWQLRQWAAAIRWSRKRLRLTRSLIFF